MGVDWDEDMTARSDVLGSVAMSLAAWCVCEVPKASESLSSKDGVVRCAPPSPSPSASYAYDLFNDNSDEHEAR